MEPEASSPGLQELVNSPYLSQLNPFQALYHTPCRFILTLSSRLRMGIRSGLIPLGFPTKNLHALSSLQFKLHALPISFSLSLSTD